MATRRGTYHCEGSRKSKRSHNGHAAGSHCEKRNEGKGPCEAGGQGGIALIAVGGTLWRARCGGRDCVDGRVTVACTRRAAEGGSTTLAHCPQFADSRFAPTLRCFMAAHADGSGRPTPSALAAHAECFGRPVRGRLWPPHADGVWPPTRTALAAHADGSGPTAVATPLLPHPKPRSARQLRQNASALKTAPFEALAPALQK